MRWRNVEKAVPKEPVPADWKRWFAWYPVQLDEPATCKGPWIWLEYVERRRVHVGTMLSGTAHPYFYRDIPKPPLAEKCGRPIRYGSRVSYCNLSYDHKGDCGYVVSFRDGKRVAVEPKEAENV